MKQDYTLVIKFKSNCNNNSCMAKDIAVRKYLAMLYNEWRKKVDCERHWKWNALSLILSG